ncbi:MAG: leucyl aminopeptidase [Variovorax sp.]|nr:leucyl aminopeptidase [Variovorax sp.]
MDFQLEPLTTAQASNRPADALIVLVAEGPVVATDPISTLIAQARKAGDLPDKPGRLLQMYRPPGIAARMLVLVSSGDGTAARVRSAVLAAIQALKASSPRQIALLFAQKTDAQCVHAAVLASADASYVYVTTKPKAEARSIAAVTLGAASIDGLGTAFERAVATVAGIELAKEWANRPGNHCTPSLLAQAAQQLATLPGIECEVLKPKDVAKLGMGALMAVAQGSSEPLRFIVLRYQGAAKGAAPVVLVGKGITFDTGGVSIKPAAEMDEMKFDM